MDEGTMAVQRTDFSLEEKMSRLVKECLELMMQGTINKRIRCIDERKVAGRHVLKRIDLLAVGGSAVKQSPATVICCDV